MKNKWSLYEVSFYCPKCGNPVLELSTSDWKEFCLETNAFEDEVGRPCETCREEAREARKKIDTAERREDERLEEFYRGPR